jgi:hypothetical protein
MIKPENIGKGWKQLVRIRLRKVEGEKTLDIFSTYAEFLPGRVEGFCVTTNEHFHIPAVGDDFHWDGEIYDFCSIYGEPGPG